MAAPKVSIQAWGCPVSHAISMLMLLIMRGVRMTICITVAFQTMTFLCRAFLQSIMMPIIMG